MPVVQISPVEENTIFERQADTCALVKRLSLRNFAATVSTYVVRAHALTWA